MGDLPDFASTSLISTLPEPATARRADGVWRSAWRRFRRDGAGMVSLAVVLAYAVLMPAFDRQDAFQSVTFRMRDPLGFAALKKRLESDPRLGVQVKTERAFYSEQSQMLGNMIRVSGVVITLIMGVGAIFGAMNTMYAAVSQRTREIAVLLTLGFSKSSITISFLIESVLLALVGGVIGCFLALPINGITTSTTNWSSFSEVAFAFRVTPFGLLLGMIFAAAMGLVGGFLPARKAASQTLASSLRAM